MLRTRATSSRSALLAASLALCAALLASAATVLESTIPRLDFRLESAATNICDWKRFCTVHSGHAVRLVGSVVPAPLFAKCGRLLVYSSVYLARALALQNVLEHDRLSTTSSVSEATTRRGGGCASPWWLFEVM